MVGGGRRQAGIIAAGAMFALERHRTRLTQDHANAKTFAAGIASLPGIELNPDTVETNIVILQITTMPAATLAGKLLKAGVHVLATGPDTIRAVTHLDVFAEQIAEAVEIFRKLLIT